MSEVLSPMLGIGTSWNWCSKLDGNRVFLGKHCIWCCDPLLQPFARTPRGDALQVGANERATCLWCDRRRIFPGIFVCPPPHRFRQRSPRLARGPYACNRRERNNGHPSPGTP